MDSSWTAGPSKTARLSRNVDNSQSTLRNIQEGRRSHLNRCVILKITHIECQRIYSLDLRLPPRGRTTPALYRDIMQSRVVIPYRRFGTSYRPNLQGLKDLGSTAIRCVTFRKGSNLVCMILFIRNRLLCSDCNVCRHQIQH